MRLRAGVMFCRLRLLRAPSISRSSLLCRFVTRSPPTVGSISALSEPIAIKSNTTGAHSNDRLILFSEA